MTTAMEKWNKIVEIILQNKNSAESSLQSKWEMIFSEIFGYSRLLNEIDSQRKVQIGSTQKVIPDIIIRNSTANKDVFVVELKISSASLNNGTINARNQLISYCKQLELQIGLVISDKIYVFYYQKGKSADDQVYIEIPFTKDFRTGEKFVELFNKSNYSDEKIIDFIREIKNKQLDAVKIKDALNIDLLKKITKEYFCKTYEEDIVESILNNYTFSIERVAKVVRPVQINNENYFTQDSNSSLTQEQIKLCYEYGKKYYSNTISLPTAGKEIATHTGMNESSAKMYVDVIKNMLSGKRYTRTINADAYEYYFQKILEDFGKERLREAIQATIFHSDYYQETTGTIQKKLRKICDKFLKEKFNG